MCGPFTCDFPDPGRFRWLQRWRCSRCGTVYVRARKVRDWYPWPLVAELLGLSYSSAPRGSWVQPLVARGRIG